MNEPIEPTPPPPALPPPIKRPPQPGDVRWAMVWKKQAAKEVNGVLTETSRKVPVLQQWKQVRHSVTDGQWQNNYEWVDAPFEDDARIPT